MRVAIDAAMDGIYDGDGDEFDDSGARIEGDSPASRSSSMPESNWSNQTRSSGSGAQAAALAAKLWTSGWRVAAVTCPLHVNIDGSNLDNLARHRQRSMALECSKIEQLGRGWFPSGSA